MRNKTAAEFWKERFGESPKNDSEKLAVAMMTEYADYVRRQQTVPKTTEINAWCATNKKVGNVENISFVSTKAKITKRWGGCRVIRKCKIIIYE